MTGEYYLEDALDKDAGDDVAGLTPPRHVHLVIINIIIVVVIVIIIMSTLPPTMARPRGCWGSLYPSTSRLWPQNLAEGDCISP